MSSSSDRSKAPRGKGLLVRYRVAITAALAVTLVVALALGAADRREGVLPPQPIAFNHALHLDKIQGVTCEDCHQFAGSETYAGLPSKTLCFDCHSPGAESDDPEAEANRAEFASLMGFAATEGDIPWQRVTATGGDVYFSHRRHVTVAGIACRDCHPEMPEHTAPPTRGPRVISMETCIECHESGGHSTDCVSCHR